MHKSNWKIVSAAEIKEDLSSVENLDIERLLESDSLFDIGFNTISKRKIYLMLELAKVERKLRIFTTLWSSIITTYAMASRCINYCRSGFTTAGRLKMKFIK